MIKKLKDVNFGKMCDMAADFCQTFNAAKNIDLNATSLHQTFGFINSEVRELKEALKNNDVPETVDAYVDIAYFALTEAYKYGLLDSVKALAHSVSNNFQINFAYMPIEVAMGCLQEMIHGDKSKFPLAILNIVRSCAGMSRYLADFEAAFKLVHEANMDKICSSEEQGKETVRKYFDQGVACFYERNARGQFIVKRLSDKKILKRIGWQAPSLKPTIFGQ